MKGLFFRDRGLVVGVARGGHKKQENEKEKRSHAPKQRANRKNENENEKSEQRSELLYESRRQNVFLFLFSYAFTLF